MSRAWLYSLTILIGLWVSATAFGGLLPDNLAEWPVNIWCWGVFVYIYKTTGRKERIEMITVLAFATPMELFFSEVWNIYEYQRGLMPLFVPAGHYFLFDLGRIMANKMKQSLALPILIPFIPMVAYGFYDGSDTSGLILLILVLVFTRFGPQPRLYASMAWAALAMEIVGTQLGNWTWANEVPWTGLTAWNPPLLVGAFYCFGDLLVNMTVVRFEEKAPVGLHE
ncbi:MAG TPA: hypothetical protein D7H99_04165 [Candidatus Poseidoniales archaeon]|nr:MAG TPA: hypothetical protein D7H99_04165 [Candidatus Poseidoniales archaeon]HII58134.1 hypothetical protein [Candidatus Poseidoniaceae archaeon]|tara:strand:+ start:5411 stop:6085 length:675 start_codon:yes stop_codon:yes gene_type:complete